MAILSNVKTVFKADITDHKRKVKQLRDEEKRAAQARLRELEEQNSKLEKNIATLGKVAAGVAAVGAAYVAARESFQEYAKRTQLESAAAGVNIEKLQKASRGLLSEMQLLELAAKAQNSAFGATQGELKEVAEMYTLLVSRGHDATEVFDELTRAVVEGNAEGLKKFGVQIKTTSDTVKGFNDIIGEFRRQTDAAGEEFPIAGESIMAAGKSMEDAFSRLKKSVGELVNTLAPAISKLAEFVSGMVKGWDIILKGDFIGGRDKSQVERFMDGSMGNEELIRLLRNPDFERALDQELNKEGAAEVNATIQRMVQFLREQSATIPRSKGGGKGGGSGPVDFSDGVPIGSSPMLPGRFGSESQRNRHFANQLGGGDFSGLTPPELTGAFAADSGPSMLERTLGSLQEFEAYTGAFSALQGASQSAFASWVDGSKSAGEAIKGMFGEAIKSIANEMFARSLQHAAAAVGSLAIGNMPGAAKHAKAAALYGAGAVAVGGIARSMGSGGAAGGGGGGGVSAGGTPPAVSPAASAGSQGTNVTVYMGSDFAANDQRQQQQKLKRALVDGGLANDGAVIFS